LQENNSNCETCPARNFNNLKKLGIDMSDYNYVVALAGNPNTGKSTVFNSLTGLKQHTGNWPGKTVSRAEGGYEFNSKKYKLVDLPGTYSLLSTSTDEDIARNFILFGQPDATIIVVDATRLERNLNLTLQVLEITDRAVLCLNLMDEAERNDIKINVRALSKELGIPVIPAQARQKIGISELISAIEDVITGKFVCTPRRLKKYHSKIERAIDEVSKDLLSEFPNLPNARWVALRLLEGDQNIINSVKTGEIADLLERQKQDVINET